jgi:hypothetical protein
MLAILLVAVIDFARVFYYDILATAAARNGVFSASNGDDNTTVIATAKEAVPDAVRSALNVTISPDCAGRDASPTPVWTTVTIQYTFQPATPLMSALLGGAHTITRKASQRVRFDCT